jgi:hypothetical protein
VMMECEIRYFYHPVMGAIPRVDPMGLLSVPHGLEARRCSWLVLGLLSTQPHHQHRLNVCGPAISKRPSPLGYHVRHSCIYLLCGHWR